MWGLRRPTSCVVELIVFTEAVAEKPWEEAWDGGGFITSPVRLMAIPAGGVRCAPSWPHLPGGVCDSSQWERSRWELGCSKETAPGGRRVAPGPPWVSVAWASGNPVEEFGNHTVPASTPEQSAAAPKTLFPPCSVLVSHLGLEEAKVFSNFFSSRRIFQRT